MVNDAKVVAVMHYRVYNILKFLFSCPEPYILVVLDQQTSFLIDFSIYRGGFKVSE